MNDAHPNDPVQADPVQAGPPPSDPLALAAEWLPTNDDPNRPQIALATNGIDGLPDVRTVLLTEFDGERFFFHTDATSRKVAELDADRRAAFSVLWPNFTRQLVVRGTVERAPETELRSAYQRRSPYLKQLAWQNTAEFAALPFDERVQRWAAEAERFAGAEAEPPSTWIGFALRPERLLFWVSNPATASRRIEYIRDGSGWLIEHRPG